MQARPISTAKPNEPQDPTQPESREQNAALTPDAQHPTPETNSSVKPCAPPGESSKSAGPKAKNRKPKAVDEPTHGLTPEDYAEFHARSVRVRSRIRNILLTSPSFPRFYADIIQRYAPNSNEANILRPHYQKICDKVNNMAKNATCTHIKVTGVRCGSPALTGEQFCYFHQNAHRTVRRPKQSRLHPIALIEDEESIQYALMEVMNALMRNTIDLKRATLILRALHIAVKNARRVDYNTDPKEVVTKIPEYAEAAEEENGYELTPIDLPAVAANPNLAVGPQGPHYWEQQSEAARRKAKEDSQRFAAESKAMEEIRQHWAEERTAHAKARAELNRVATADAENVHVGTAAIGGPEKPQASPAESTTTHVGTDSFVRPEKPEASAPVQAAVTTKHSATIPPHNFKTPPQPTPESKKKSTPGPQTSAPQRKPPASTTGAPKERKNTAHRASGGLGGKR